MSDCTRTKKISKKRSKRQDEPGTLNEQPKRKKARKSHRETRDDEGGAENEECQIVNLPDENSLSRDEVDEVVLIRDDPDVTEMKEADDEQRGSTSGNENSGHSEDSESDEDMGDSSESELEMEMEPEDRSQQFNNGNLARKQLQKSLTRDIELAELEENESVSEEKIKQLQIVIDWEPPPLHLFRRSLSTIKKEEREELKEKGITVKTGKWTQEEDQKLAENWRRFSKEYDIRNPAALLGMKNGFRTSVHQGVEFATYLGQGLDDRTLLSIYQQARRMLDPRHFQGRFSDMEWKMLKRLIARHGNKWALISQKMDRSPDALHDYYKANAKNYNRGRWKSAEDQRLFSAMTGVSEGMDLLDVHHGLPWTEVAEIVRTRHAAQCRERWLSILSWAICGKFSKKVWKTEDNIRLIKMLRDSAYQNSSDVPWHSIYERFGLLNCYQLKSKWECLKVRVPRYFFRPFNEILDWLVEHHLPILKQRVKDRKKNEQRRAEQKKEKRKKKSEEVCRVAEKACSTKKQKVKGG